MYWIIFPICASILWGIGYALMSQVSDKLLSYTINASFGLSMFVLNIMALIATKNTDNLVLIKNQNILLYLCGYCIFAVFGSFCYLYGYSTDVNIGIYTSISSTYAVTTFLLGYFLFGQNNFNMYYAVSGILMIFGGTILLALSK